MKAATHMQLGAEFDLNLTECQAVMAILDEEIQFHSISDSRISAENLYQTLSKELQTVAGTKISCHWDLPTSYCLLNRLLVACPALAKSCGMHKAELADQYPIWESKSIHDPALETACASVLMGMGFAIPM
ncbi:MAG: hypothetical protein QM719_13090 [Thermomonas sp.]